MNKIIALVLIIAGVYVCYLGNARRNSVAGSVANASATVANKIDGGPHVTNATWYFVGGGLLIVAGAFSLTRRS
jgi:hypothetical protein